MPLARILTAFPERAESLAQQLRDHGYTVEFLSPEKAGMLRADLEIDFEICDQKVVLRRAAELANKLHTDIAVSPDALPANFAASDTQIYVSEQEIVEVPSHIPDPFVETFLAQGDRTGQINNLEKSEHMISLPPDMLASESAKANAPGKPFHRARSRVILNLCMRKRFMRNPWSPGPINRRQRSLSAVLKSPLFLTRSRTPAHLGLRNKHLKTRHSKTRHSKTRHLRARHRRAR